MGMDGMAKGDDGDDDGDTAGVEDDEGRVLGSGVGLPWANVPNIQSVGAWGCVSLYYDPPIITPSSP